MEGQVTREWTNPAGGEFHFPFNWDGGVPFRNDDAVFAIESTYTVDLTASAEVNTVEFLDGTVTFIGGNSLTALADSTIANNLIISGTGTDVEIQGILNFGLTGPNPFASLILEPGSSLQTDSAFPGGTMGTIAEVRLEDNSEWVTDNLFIGAGGVGIGIVTADAGAALVVGSASPNSEQIRVGSNVAGGATVEIHDSSTLVVPDHHLNIASIIGHSGSVLVSGAISTLVAADVEVGGLGDGELAVEGGGALRGVDMEIARGVFSESSVTVTGPDSSVLLSGNLIVADNGDGGLLIDDHAVFETDGEFTMASGSGSVASVLVADGATLDVSGETFVGGQGMANLTISEATLNSLGNVTVTTGSSLEISGSENITPGTLNLQGTLDVSGLVRLSNGNVFNLFGSVTLSGSGVLRTPANAHGTFHSDVINEGLEINTRPGGTTFITQDYDGLNPFTGSGTVKFGNTFSSVGQTGRTTFEGNVDFLSTSSVEMEIGGFSVGELDQLQIAGDLDVEGGDLAIEFVNGFVPEPGDQIPLISIDGDLDGTFNGLPQGAFVAGLPGVDLFISYQSL